MIITKDETLEKIDWTELLAIESFRHNIPVYKMKGPVDIIDDTAPDSKVLMAATKAFNISSYADSSDIVKEIVESLNISQ